MIGSPRNVAGGTQRFADWLLHKRDFLKLKPFRNIQAHCHQHTEAHFYNDLKVMGLGCLSRPTNYSLDNPRLNYTRITSQGLHHLDAAAQRSGT